MARAATFARTALDPPLSVVRRFRLASCVFVVLLAHAALLAATESHHNGIRPPPGATTVRLRLVAGDGANPTMALAEGSAGQRLRVEPTSDGPSGMGAPKGRGEIVAAVAGESAAPPPRGTADDDEMVYLPRVALSVAPRSRAPVTVAYPHFDGEADGYTGEFEVFIDDTGGVVRVVNTTPDLPGILVNAVREAFLPALFHPGERDGRTVRSRIRIEVSFDKGTLPSS